MSQNVARVDAAVLDESDVHGFVLEEAPPRANASSVKRLKPLTEAAISPSLFSHPPRPVVATTLKRLLDVLGASVGLLLLAPVMLVVAALIKLSSPGPVLFVQKRAGYRGKPFRCFKFRTMRVGADAEKQRLMQFNEMSGPVFKMKNDPRVTQVGRILRETSLDELPQLINVLLGDMSLVGPRPPSLDELPRYKAHHWRRLSVVPGVSGLWQVSGRSSIPDFERWVALDLQYIDTWSLWLDVKIILKTIPAVLSKRGAA